MVEFIPLTKVSDRKTTRVMRSVPSDFMVVRLLDFISPITLKLNKIFYEVKQAGGLHQYYDETRKIILSLIVRDDIARRLLPHDYAYIINSLKPDFSTTPDCETYNGEKTFSASEIGKSIFLTIKLLELCPDTTLIGHVKGCDDFLVEKHTQILKSFGINDFLFHVGDFFRHGDPKMILKARNLAFKIRPHAKKLFLYGMGSQSQLIGFSFADYYITNTHFGTARNGEKFEGTKKRKYTGLYNVDIVKSNFLQIQKNLASSKDQEKLFKGGECPWEEEQEEVLVPVTQQEKQ